MSLTIHLNAVIIGGAVSAVSGFLMLAIGVPVTWGRDRGGWMPLAGVVLMGGGVVSVLIGIGMAVKS